MRKQLLLIGILALMLVACGGMEAEAPDDAPQGAANEAAADEAHRVENPAAGEPLIVNEAPEDYAPPAADAHSLANPAGQPEARREQPFDVRYIDAMIAHHTEGANIARTALENAESDEIREMAQAMYEAHAEEIAQLREWRAEWYGDLELTDGMEMAMPESARFIVREESLDRTFLRVMTAHHAAAYEMSVMALDHFEHDELREFAQMIIDHQAEEMDQMQQMLAENE